MAQSNLTDEGKQQPQTCHRKESPDGREERQRPGLLQGEKHQSYEKIDQLVVHGEVSIRARVITVDHFRRLLTVKR
mgnify:CR=1 FL=1